METLSAWLDYVGLTGEHLGAFALGTLVSLLGTQGVKRLVPHIEDHRSFFLALVLGFVPTYTTAPPEGWGFDWSNVWLGVVAGLAATRVYRISLWAAEKWAPGLAHAMTGDRGVGLEPRNKEK